MALRCGSWLPALLLGQPVGERGQQTVGRVRQVVIGITITTADMAVVQPELVQVLPDPGQVAHWRRPARRAAVLAPHPPTPIFFSASLSALCCLRCPHAASAASRNFVMVISFTSPGNLRASASEARAPSARTLR